MEPCNSTVNNEVQIATINICLCDPSGNEVFYRMKPTSRFNKVFRAFCQKMHFDINIIRFLYEGQRVNGNQTPEDLQMEDMDIISCFIEQTGGISQ